MFESRWLDQAVRAAELMTPLFATILAEGAEDVVINTSSAHAPSPWFPFIGLRAERTAFNGYYEFTFVLPEDVPQDEAEKVRLAIPDVLGKFGWKLHDYTKGGGFRVQEWESRRGLARHLRAS